MGKENKSGIDGSKLKLIAMITMLIDHVGASLIERYINSVGVGLSENGDSISAIEIVDIILRMTGRLAFPIFIFLMVEGAIYTSNRWKYLFRLCVFAIISEIPFDIAFNIAGSDVKKGCILTFGYQNVFFTLALGLLAIICIDKINMTKISKLPSVLFQMVVCVIIMAVAIFLRTDYSWEGVLAIVVSYVVKTRSATAKDKELLQEDGEAYRVLKNNQTITSCCLLLTVLNLIEITCFFDILFVKKYNGQKGRGSKFAFYAFYPAHLFILGLICVAFGI